MKCPDCGKADSLTYVIIQVKGWQIIERNGKPALGERLSKETQERYTSCVECGFKKPGMGV